MTSNLRHEPTFLSIHISHMLMCIYIAGGSCYNEFPDDSICIDLAQSGECTLSPEWMGRYCRKACDACDGNGLPIG